MRQPIILAFAALVLATAATAQQRVEIEALLAEGLVIHGLGTPVDATPGNPTPPGDGASGDPDRLKRLKALSFDRRPSAILDIWSKPAPKPVEIPPEVAPPADADAVETNADGSPGTTDAQGADDAGPGTAPATDTAVPADTTDTTDTTGTTDTADTADTADSADSADSADTTDTTDTDVPTVAAPTPEQAATATAAAARLAALRKALEVELQLFQRYVTLGDWVAVDTYLAELEGDTGRAAYAQLLKSLQAGPPKPKSQFAAFAETNLFAPEDILGLAACAPHALDNVQLQTLGRLLRQCLDAGSLVEECMQRFEQSLTLEQTPLTAHELARITFDAGLPVEAGRFLPELGQAIADDDRPALNMIARHYLARHERDGERADLETVWRATQAALALGTIEKEDKQEALKRAVEIAPRLREELGAAWLDESFTTRPGRGMEILATIGGAAAAGFIDQGRDADARFKTLQLQTTAADALLAAAPERADEWRETLNVLAVNWLREAEFTYKYDESTQRGPQLERDYYGNFFYNQYRPSNSNQRPTPLRADDVLDIRPSETWIALIDGAVRPRFDMLTAQLLLKVNEESDAFPFIERVADVYPERAEELVNEFLRVWARNHNPNSENQRSNQYVFFYGFEQRANAIPLTRSKQQRNLAELAEWIARLRQLPIDDLDEALVANCFTAAHSVAEVYRVETIESVFGAMQELEPETMAELVHRMRSNLVGVWRDPSVQKDKQTRRRQKDIQNEILRGYEVALSVADRGLADHPDDWALTLARAAVLHDENNYAQEIARSSDFAARREAAFAEFARAAELYAAGLAERPEDEETSRPYDTWFYAALGACDLGAVTHEQQPVGAQFPAIRAALSALPDEAAERHTGQFANTLFTRMSSVSPDVKFRYVRHGLDIAGDHERAELAREVYDYYKDLVTEIRLETNIDGPDRVGHGEPFGLLVNIRHTREIEREAGGFAKYLVNQNNQGFSYNYGRPTEDYRDKFEEAARESLDEHFEVLSVTFNHPDTHSRAVEEYGWRVTPYAYVLLQARGPQIDRVPPLRFDLDFLDTTGYAVLPVESAPRPIDATQRSTDVPFANLELVQTLDERQANEGRLVLEVKASATGLVPELETLADLGSEGFEVASIDDQGVSVIEFDQEGDGIGILSERSWQIVLHAEEDLVELPETFHFASTKVDGAELLYQRYVDADLETVEPVVSLAASYGERDLGSITRWAVGLGALLVLVVVAVSIARRPRQRALADDRFRMPETLSAFTVIGLLRDIDSQNGISAEHRRELQTQISQLEEHYFRNDGGADPDLRTLAETWVGRAS